MSPEASAEFFSSPRFPRVSGDEPSAIMSYPSMLKFSPRERG